MVNLNVPYLSQLNNSYNPYGSCNVTSLAMVLQWAGKNVSPDSLYNEMLNLGWSRHSPYDLAKMAERKGIVDSFFPDARLEDIKNHLNKGNPCIVHGYFTDFGHIITIKGYDDYGFICHDPYGEWCSDGYLLNGNDLYGKNVRYSFRLIRDLCDEGGIWTHFCESGEVPPPRPVVSPRYDGVSLQDIFHDDLSITHSEIFNIEVHLTFQVQVKLTDKYDGKRDAIFGPKTQKALEEYCKEINLPADPITKPLAKFLIERKNAKLR